VTGKCWPDREAGQRHINVPTEPAARQGGPFDLLRGKKGLPASTDVTAPHGPTAQWANWVSYESIDADIASIDLDSVLPNPDLRTEFGGLGGGVVSVALTERPVQRVVLWAT
jgi:hypothetical protein